MATSTTILFVDDEPLVLDGLRNLLRRQRKEWNMVFAASAESALQELEKRPFDVVVTDMRMPRMDGATLLEVVKGRCPGAIRILLTGQADQEMARKTISVAHQLLSKPCQGDTIPKIIRRTCDLRDFIKDERLLVAFERTGGLPPGPRVHAELTAALDRPEHSVEALAEIIDRNRALSKKLLVLINSPSFGPSQRTSSTVEAIRDLGLEVLRSLTLLLGAMESFPAGATAEEAHLLRAILVGRVASHIARGPVDPEDAFAAGVLANIGRQVIRARDLAEVDPAEVGAYLLGRWGLPYPLVEAIAHHRSPGRLGSAVLDLATVVHIAGALVEACVRGTPEKELLDGVHLDKLNQTASIPRWKKLTLDHIATLEGGRHG